MDCPACSPSPAKLQEGGGGSQPAEASMGPGGHRGMGQALTELSPVPGEGGHRDSPGLQAAGTDCALSWEELLRI